ncbi:PREDICTED: uncharacterized protein LOC105366083 [Ceratosolen solmsi marchali]|uniref:Uncharacterized protein LOC105366083 n=1 Tax=Ceratosolen solmsi marchali TaxID=326594 RepID=A0AAJ6YR41_9HYME|nr:PREDICTED: uncharacterized protein LOC105366083 [Ceratosolen solmsi marchali]
MENQETDELKVCSDKSQDQPQQQQQLTCWLYVSRTCDFDQQHQQQQQQSEIGQNYRCDGLPRGILEEAIRAVEPTGSWHVSETHCGLIAGFAREFDADKLLQRGDLARIFEAAVQVARFCDRDSRYRQALLLRDVPWAIPLQDLNSALTRQGIMARSIERLRQYVRIEVFDSSQYEQLLRQGLDFFGAARFCAIPERWWRNSGVPTSQNFAGGGYTTNNNQLAELGGSAQQQSLVDDVLQCYRCQGFWHVAANCRHLPRCVRCGEPHSVEFCARPRNNPICCHCSGPHHAGYRQCPVRLQLLNATPVSLTLSINRLNSNAPTSHLLLPYGKSNNNSSNPANSATTL